MGRKSAPGAIEAFSELDRKHKAERESKEERIKRQWDDLNKYVPVYELNNDAPEAPSGDGDNKAAERKNKRKLRNSGDSSKGVRLSEVQLEVNKLVTNAERKRFHKQQKLDKKKKRQTRSAETNRIVEGADVLGFGGPPSKRPRNSTLKVLNGSSASNGLSAESPSVNSKSPTKSSDKSASRSADSQINASNGVTANESNTFIELEDLRPGPVVPFNQVEEERYEEETTENYYVTTPSDAENNQEDESDEDYAPKPRVSSFVIFSAEQNDVDSSVTDDSEETYGIDLMEDSDDLEDEDMEELAESDLDFIDDGEHEEEESDLEEEEEGLEAQPKKHLKRVVMDTDESTQLDSDISADELDALLNDQSDFPIGPRRRQPAKFITAPGDYEESSSSDEDFMASDESVDEEEEELDLSEGELEDLLQDHDDAAYNSEDEERALHLEPSGLKLKPIGLAIDGYEVDESTLKCIRLKRDKSNESAAFMPVYEIFGFSVDDDHSVSTAVKAFRWLVHPLGPQDFFEHLYTKRATVIHRSNSNFYKDVFPLSAFYKMFQENFLEYGVNVNVARYEDGVRTTHNPQGRAYAGAIRAFTDRGMSVQCVNPQSFDKNIHYLCDTLQELFNCFVGANCYYTPKGSAGFAPHYDDIDAFMIQCEGQKHWKVYAPFENDAWPLESSGNLTPDEMEQYEENLVFDGVLKAGDVLYLPRGFIHCASTNQKHHSLHVTISVAQRHTYGNLLEKVTEKLMESKTAEIAQLRKNLPVNFLDMGGVADSIYENEENFLKLLEKPVALYLQQFQIGLSAAIPAAIDEVARDFMRRALPPLLTEHEKAHTIHGRTDEIPPSPLITEHSEVRIIRKHTQRLLFESEEKAFLIHRMENSMVYEGRPEVIVDVPPELIDGVEKLMRTYPDWVSVAEIDRSPQFALETCQFLYRHGLLMVRPVSLSVMEQEIPEEQPVAAKPALKSKSSTLSTKKDFGSNKDTTQSKESMEANGAPAKKKRKRRNRKGKHANQ